MPHRGADLNGQSSGLLAAADPAPVVVQNLHGASPFLLLGDHAGVAIPAALGDLGLSLADLERHIACDLGVAGLGEVLSRRLDAALIAQRYSRLVIDCNRALDDPGSIAAVSDGSAIPGNNSLAPADRQARIDEVFQPYHRRIADELDRRLVGGRRTILVSLHSFTPALTGPGAGPRPWRYGVLHRNDSAFSRAVLAALIARHGADVVGDNQPYAMDGTDNTVPLHADPRGLDYLELETRQDLIADGPGQAAVAALIAGLLTEALVDL
jgi:predicted N-formylglutamate amidohydrolase